MAETALPTNPFLPQSQDVHGVCVDEMKTSQYAYFALHNWLFLRAQESVYETACTAQFPVMLLADRNTQPTVFRYCTPRHRLVRAA